MTVRCKRCGCIFPDDMDVCPTCQKKNRGAKKKEVSELKLRERRFKEMDNTPIEATLISTQDKTKTKKSAVAATGRAVVGGVLLGPAGAVIGAATTGSKTKVTGQKATFFVKYKSGRTGTETVDINSARFRELAAIME